MEHKHSNCAVCGDEIPVGTKLCDNCVRCPECGSKALTFYDYDVEGEATMECFSCGHTYSNSSVSQTHEQILVRYNRHCLRCGILINKFVPDTKVSLCTDCFTCPKCNEYMSFRNYKPYCWFCHMYWLPKSLIHSFGVSNGRARKRCDSQEALSYIQQEMPINNFTLEEYYRRVTEETVDDSPTDVLDYLTRHT